MKCCYSFSHRCVAKAESYSAIDVGPKEKVLLTPNAKIALIMENVNYSSISSVSVCLCVYLLFLVMFCDTLISQPKMKIITRNFQDMILGDYQVHPWCQGWPCPPSNLMKDPHSWHTSNKDINTKLSEYLPWGEIRSSITLNMTMSSNYPVRNPQRPPSTPLRDPPFLTHF